MGKQTFSDIYHVLKDRILAGHYSVKMRLPIEDELITEFDSSRYAVRKAIAQLAKDGLVYSVKGRGVVLLEHTPQTQQFNLALNLSLIHISEPTRRHHVSRMPSSA